MVNRLIKPSLSNSFFLFGARGTGKSTLIRGLLPTAKTLWIDLLDPDVEEQYIRNPNLLVSQLEGSSVKTAGSSVEWVCIDEVQKVPKLLDVVHGLIESRAKKPPKFCLTGSSARKLKRGAANLLAGRAFVYSLFPLTTQELGEKFNLSEALEWGTLPKIFSLDSTADKARFLRSYGLTYLREEIQLEQIVRQLDPFRDFLEIASQTNGQIVNYSNIGKDVGVDAKTVQSFFQILEDTLVGFTLPAYHRSVRKRQRQNPKFYFFDTGVKRALNRTLGTPLLPQTTAFGDAFEHFIITEIHRLNSYLERDYRMSYLRTKDDAEIDLIIERPGLPTALVEIKSGDRVDERHITSLKGLLPAFKKAEAFLLSRDPNRKKIQRVLALPWQEGIEELGLQ